MKRLVLILTVVGSLAVYSRVQCGVRCGVERWKIKTLTDTTAKLIKFKPKKRSINWLRAREEPSEKPDDTRLVGIETMTWKVQGLVIGQVKEADKDYHVVLGNPNDPSKTFTVEFPSLECKGG